MQVLEQLSKSYGLAIALMIIGCVALAAAVVHLYRENRAVYARIEALLSERIRALESLTLEAFNGRRTR